MTWTACRSQNGVMPVDVPRVRKRVRHRTNTYKRKVTEEDIAIVRAAFWCMGSGTAHAVLHRAKKLGLRHMHPRAIAHVLRDAALRRTLETVPRPTNPRTTQQSWVYHAR